MAISEHWGLDEYRKKKRKKMCGQGRPLEEVWLEGGVGNEVWTVWEIEWIKESKEVEPPTAKDKRSQQ